MHDDQYGNLSNFFEKHELRSPIFVIDIFDNIYFKSVCFLKWCLIVDMSPWLQFSKFNDLLFVISILLLKQVKVPIWAVKKQYEMPELVGFQTMVILDPNGMTFDAVGVVGQDFWLLFKFGSSYCDPCWTVEWNI